MEEAPSRNTYKTLDAANAKKRNGFWSNLFGRSSNADKKRDDQEPNHKGGLMNSLKDNAHQAATREVEHVAMHEAKNEIEALVHKNNNNGTQSTDPTTTTANAAPDTTTTPSDAVNASTNWVRRMADTARQRMQGLENSVSS